MLASLMQLLPDLQQIRHFSQHCSVRVKTPLSKTKAVFYGKADTRLHSSAHLRCLLVTLLDILPCTPAPVIPQGGSAPCRRLGVPSNATWYETEACGIDVFRTARENGLPIRVVQDHTQDRDIYGLISVG
jgi:hypothetical protein